MKERPVLFSGAMVNAILEGRKTQTRRVIKNFPEYERGTEPPQKARGIAPRHPAPYFDCYRNEKKTEANPRGDSEHWCWWDEYDRMGNGWLKCPYGKPGDRLWVREKFLVELPGDYRYDAEGIPPGEYPAHLQKESIVHYAATNTLKTLGAWKPSIHMPRWASRITLEIVSVRVERLNDISEEDAEREGVESAWDDGLPDSKWGPAWAAADKSNPRLTRFGARSGFAVLWESINGPGSWEANPWVWVVEFKVVKE